MLLIGLTGSIATGKSSVSNLLRSLSYPIIDADQLAREAVAPGTRAYDKIVAHFGPSTPDLLLPFSALDSSDSSTKSNNAFGAGDATRIDSISKDSTSKVGKTSPPLDRAALGRRVFGSFPSAKADRAVLNSIVHPAVRWAMVRSVLSEYLRGSRAVVLDVPLLFESALDVYCGVTIVVGIKDKEVQLQRLLKRDQEAGGKMTEKEARDRIDSQGDILGKVERCRERGVGWGEVVWNDGSRDQLEEEVQRVLGKIEERSPGWWEVLMWAFPPLAVGIAGWGWWCGVQARRRFEETQKGKEKAKL